MVSSVTGQVGDMVRLVSPVGSFSAVTEVIFRFGLFSTAADDQVSLSVYLQTQLGVPVMQQLIVGPGSSGSTGWQSFSVCVPVGEFSLVFEASHGAPFVTNIVVDSIATSLSACELPIFDEQAIRG